MCFASPLSPSHGPLRFVTTHSRFVLISLRQTKRLRRWQTLKVKGFWDESHVLTLATVTITSIYPFQVVIPQKPKGDISAYNCISEQRFSFSVRSKASRIKCNSFLVYECLIIGTWIGIYTTQKLHKPSRIFSMILIIKTWLKNIEMNDLYVLPKRKCMNKQSMLKFLLNHRKL